LSTPNKLTVLRIILTPIFLFLLVSNFTGHFVAALVVFIAASITDYFDGSIARKQNLITNFGKFLDPLADKLLTSAALLGFIHMDIGHGTVYVAFIILAREFLVTSLRLVAISNGRVIAANIWGKTKTVSQIVAIIAAMAGRLVIDQTLVALPAGAVTAINIVSSVLLWFSALLTIISGVTYFLENREHLDSSK